MDRRQALTALGVGAVSLAGPAAPAAEHGQKDKPGGRPVDQFHAYLCAFHVGKKDPTFVVEAHHYCMPVGDEVHQCCIFDKNGPGAKLLGVEYIISDKLYRQLPDAEKKYYHPHVYEITSGMLVAPDLAPDKELELMKGLLLTWGKTWHTWPDPQAALPLGEPLLMWAATRDGQIPEAALAARDRKYQIDTPGLRQKRAVLGPVPQVDPPKSVDSLGRQWTNDGPDVPRK
jgi:hypothetical protein